MGTGNWQTCYEPVPYYTELPSVITPFALDINFISIIQLIN